MPVNCDGCDGSGRWWNTVYERYYQCTRSDCPSRTPKATARLIGVLGPAGVGKDTFADHLALRHRFTKMSLADPMKEICSEVFGWDNGQLWGPSSNRNVPDPKWDGLTPRKALQLLGTEWGRACHPEVWIRYTVRKAKEKLEQGTSVVVPDIRFANEVEAIQAAGGQVVRLRRPVDPLAGPAAYHASELEQQAIPDETFDHVIVVADGIPNFHAQIDQLVTWLENSPQDEE